MRHDPVKIMSHTFAWMDHMLDIVDKMDEKKVFEMMNTHDAMDIFEYVRSVVK